MNIITRKSLAAYAAMRWKGRYFNENNLHPWLSDDKEKTHSDLIALGENPNPDDVDSIIGNDSWTATICDECGSKNVAVVVIGEPRDYESSTAEICKDCLATAIEMVNEND